MTGMYFRCTCCNSEITPMKKKPCTTYSGAMLSKFTDSVSDFPTDEWEDLCHNCRNSIANYNAKFYSPDGEVSGEFDNHFVEYNHVSTDESYDELSDARLDYGFQIVDDVYNGYRDD